jgi:hypothetical protein
MQTCNSNIIHEKSIIIPIKKNLSKFMKINSYKYDYSINENLFDPSKSSPPNNFMNNLQKRIKIYSNIFYEDNMVVSRDKE